MTIPKHLLLVVTVVMVTLSCYYADGSVVISGSLVFQRNWSDFQVSQKSRQYKQMKYNIKNSLQKHFEDDPEFWNVTVTQLREDHPSKQSALQGKLAAEFKLHLQNKSMTGLGRLRDAITMGYLGNMPVERSSLHLQGIPINTIPRDYNIWPSGFYGLPKPKTGCPGDEWKEGFRYQDSENFNNINNQSAHSHISGNVTNHGVKQDFCMHDIRETDVHRQWPMGKYCIYKYGDECPKGLHEGWVYWDDENTPLDYPNEYGGALPDGMYGGNTLIYYCCDDRGKISTPMMLPNEKPFYLFPYGTKQCQQVHQFKVSLEYILFDDEDQANKNSRSFISPYGPSEDLYNTRLYYCYYQPIPCGEEHRGNPACFPHFLPSSDDGTSMMMNDTTNNNTVYIKHSHRAFAVGSGIGMMLMGWTALVVTLQRIQTTRKRRSFVVHYY